MQTSQISQTANQVNPAQAGYLPKPKQPSPAQGSQLKTATVQANKSDTVSFSREALQKLATNDASYAKKATGSTTQQLPARISVKA